MLRETLPGEMSKSVHTQTFQVRSIFHPKENKNNNNKTKNLNVGAKFDKDLISGKHLEKDSK